MNPLLRFDAPQLARDFNSRAFSFAHSLVGSPLFELPRIARLADTLFKAGGRRDVYNSKAGSRFGQAFEPNAARPVGHVQAIEEIGTSDSWMVLKRIEQDPQYRDIVEACLAELGRAVPELARHRLRSAEGFLFVTSPGGITPYHIDPQWSFLAQLHGQKTYRIYDVLDPDVIGAPEIEEYYCGEKMAARYSPEKDARSAVFRLDPGMCVNQPLHAPHSAHVGAGYSVSLTVAVISDAWAWQAPVHRANRWLRRHGIVPSPVGRHPVTDTLKSLAYRASARIARDARRLAGPHGELRSEPH